MPNYQNRPRQVRKFVPDGEFIRPTAEVRREQRARIRQQKQEDQINAWGALIFLLGLGLLAIYVIVQINSPNPG